jgi:hypothetical protein
MWMLTEASDLPSSGQSDSAIIHSYLLANLVPYSFFPFNADIHRETAVYEKMGQSEEWGSVALWRLRYKSASEMNALQADACLSQVNIRTVD